MYGDVYEKNNADVLTVLGDVLKGSVPVNELNPDGTENKSIVGSTILLGACKTEGGITPVVSVVNHAKDTNVTPEVYVYPLKSVNAQERSPDAFDTHSGTTAQDEISIANLIALAQPLHPQIFSRDVSAKLGTKYRGDEINARFSAGNARPIFNKSLFIAGRARVADPADWGEQTPGALAASSELSNQGVTQMQSYGAIRKMSLPLPLCCHKVNSVTLLQQTPSREWDTLERAETVPDASPPMLILVL